jgi:hypothetical protein
VRPESSGFLTLAATEQGAYSGKVQLTGTRRRFSGRFDLAGRATNTLSRPATNALTLELSLDLLDETHDLRGRLSDGVWMAPLQADRAGFNRVSNPAPWAGRYTMDIPDDEISSGPEGDGIGSVSVAPGGSVGFVGTMADGTPVTQGTFVSSGGQWPLYVPMYRGKGSLLGWLNFTNDAGNRFEGAVSLIKPTLPPAKFYPAGFTNTSVAVGAMYHPPASPVDRVLNFADGQIVFREGDHVPFTNFVSLGANNKVTNLGSNALVLTFSLPSGRWNGWVIDPSSGRKLLFTGTVLQDQSVGIGFSLGTNQSGCVRLEAR